jgi:hypothetical protein
MRLADQLSQRFVQAFKSLIKFPMIPSTPTIFFFFIVTTCFCLSPDHRQVFAASVMYALCLTSNANL